MNVNNVLIYRPCERLENILKVNILVFGEVGVAHLFSFLCCVFCFVCLCPVACVPNVASVSRLFIFVILPSVFCNVYLLYFFSYGGMLSAYMRFKYPGVIAGSIASSAPILLLDPDFPNTFFWKTVTKVYKRERERERESYGVSRHFQQYLIYIVAVSFIGEENQKHLYILNWNQMQ